MRLYQMLFGRFCKPEGDDTGAGGGAAGDRGDSWTPTETPATELKENLEKDDVKTATGEKDEDEGEDEDEDDKGEKGEKDDARHKDGKFAKKGEGTMIPKARFDDAIRKEREQREAAERRLAELTKAQAQIKLTADIGEMETKVSELRAQERKAIVAGDEEKAAQLSAEADRLNRQIAIQQSSSMTATAKEEALEGMRFDMAVESLQEQYPQLNEEAEEFDQDLVDDVLDKQRGYMERDRLSPSKALIKAAKYIMDRHARNAEPAKEDKGGLKDGKQPTDRKKAAVEKNLDASKRQPGNLRELGADSDKAGQTKEVPAAADMTFEEFSALPEATKAKMRGDLL